MHANLLYACFAVMTALARGASFADSAAAATNMMTPLDRTLVKEPAYQATPKYSLITLGNRREVKVWMVEDGRQLYVDQNGNGDLTDDGPPLQPGKVRDLGANRWDFEYTLEAIAPPDGTRHTSLVLRRWNYGEGDDSYGLSLSVNGQMPLYGGWFGTFWATNRAQAPVTHFGGPFTPRLLRRKEFTIGETQQRLSLCFLHPGSGPGAESRLSIEALPRYVVPELTIEWPTAPDRAPLRTSHELTLRCCYWEFYATEFAVLAGVVAGQAKVSVRLPMDAMLISLTTTEMVIPVVAPSPKSDLAR